jgi:hypothetical protein
MHPDEAFVMRPVIEKIISYDAAFGGELDIVDFARMNEALDIKAENSSRIRRALKKEK